MGCDRERPAGPLRAARPPARDRFVEARRVSGTDWTKFRVERISAATFLKRNLIHTDLLTAAVRRAKGSLLEVGVGSGAQSALVSRLVPCTIALDNDPRIITAARPNLERFGNGVHLVRGDAFALPFADGSFGVAISQGLMEHFDDARIQNLLREQLRVCNSVVFSVPSDRYPRQDVGDERLMAPMKWLSLVEAAVDTTVYRAAARYYRFDPESLKYSLHARRSLGGFSVLVTIDPR
ncbi:MAG: methyltransferase domain-containing protein [Gemmatimonas sp.]|nr:methyltransferase domain-containing protein [Gemmatimonas sp.]